MRIGILVIGDEILTGRRQDKHFANTLQTLARRGRRLWWARFIGDDAALLTQQLREVRANGDLCFSFGGIGATPDDLTRQCVADAYDVPLVRHPDAKAEIEAKFGESAYPNRILMADLPQGARTIPNPVSRVPGFSLDHMHCLPGFPNMALPMTEWVLDTYYAQLPCDYPVHASVLVHNVPESSLIPWMNQFVAHHPDVKLFSLPRTNEVGQPEIELGVAGAGDAPERALREIKQMLETQGHRYSEPK
ncbi:MAG TPA: molybdopterin-binding protein [Burkholderiales bacterium]|nr:molybdopterin-binding protein [Burkholderiales bacterium]